MIHYGVSVDGAMVYAIHYATMSRFTLPPFLPAAAKSLLPEAWLAAWRQQSMSYAFRSALATPQVSLAYQPVVDLASGKQVGAEALLRWQRRDTFVSPDLFIGAAEQAGIMKQVTARVLELVVQDAAAVLAGGSRGHISINLSAADLGSHATVARLQRLLEATRLPSECFWIEATERGFLGGDRARSVVAELRRMGFKVAIDDFGTGYSSLAVLDTFKLDILKIDKAFTASIGTGETKVIEHIIQLAKSLGLDLVAEGVETLEQAAFLQSQGVAFAQGWLFGRPVSPRDFQNAVTMHTSPGRYAAPVTPTAA